MTDAPDYKSTVFLPVTDFPMKAGLAQKEPAIAAKWEAIFLRHSWGVRKQMNEFFPIEPPCD